MEYLVSLAILALATCWVQSFDQAFDCSRLLCFRVGGPFVEPSLIVVEFHSVLPKSRLVYDFVRSELLPEVARLVVVAETAIVKMDVAIAT